MANMLVMGVDENGLGPRLGPLVATSVALQVPRYARAALCERGLALGLTDSKETGGFGRMGFTESVALALVKRGGAGLPARRTSFSTRSRLSPASAFEPAAPTSRPPGSAGRSISAAGVWWRCVLRRAAARSAGRPLEPSHRRRAKPSRLRGDAQREARRRRNKLAVDLELFEDLICAVHDRHGSPLLAVCGMIGGIRDYASRFSRFESQSVGHSPDVAVNEDTRSTGVGEFASRSTPTPGTFPSRWLPSSESTCARSACAASASSIGRRSRS